jgi:hypothetical protein
MICPATIRRRTITKKGAEWSDKEDSVKQI